MKEEKWIRVTNTLECIEGENPQEVRSPHTKYWIKAIYMYDHTTSYGNSYKMYRYELFDRELNETEIQIGNLSVVSMRETQVHAFAHCLDAVLKDSAGHSQIRPFSAGSFNNVMALMFAFLDEHQESNSLHELELSLTNSNLTKENLRLEERIVDLQEEVLALTTQLEDEREVRNDGLAE